MTFAVFPQGTDISDHLPTLYMLARMSSYVVEFGVRDGVSTRAIIESGTPSLHVDIEPAPFPFEKPHWFAQASSLDVRIPPTDLLFIDTEHTYEQLSRELALHCDSVHRWIAMHDTEKFPDLRRAIADFLETDNGWEFLTHYQNNNGMTILQRVMK